ncbi:hypothetical protein PsYK624_133710 [Phanerochaete sordida]|uniref:Uncharacterized protein n=1 Tax=Phanerochaete sordida TaxID=48140 RepID=A0A9P3GJQ2_9APHY|nr:hypothetical protein PsYK624_133710 [Phanerochaete sordida]
MDHLRSVRRPHPVAGRREKHHGPRKSQSSLCRELMVCLLSGHSHNEPRLYEPSLFCLRCMRSGEILAFDSRQAMYRSLAAQIGSEARTLTVMIKGEPLVPRPRLDSWAGLETTYGSACTYDRPWVVETEPKPRLPGRRARTTLAPWRIKSSDLH